MLEQEHNRCQLLRWMDGRKLLADEIFRKMIFSHDAARTARERARRGGAGRKGARGAVATQARQQMAPQPLPPLAAAGMCICPA